jgi:hypothetical protein
MQAESNRLKGSVSAGWIASSAHGVRGCLFARTERAFDYRVGAQSSG